MHDKVVSNIQEILARKGRVIVITSQGTASLSKLTEEIIYVPKTTEIISPILTVIPAQLFAYYIAINRGCDVDQPRNLAKSVTVE